MPLTVAVQMDPIERIRIAGDSTFALLLEAQARGHSILHYTPDRLRLNGTRVEVMAEPLSVKDVEGDHARLGEAKLVDLSTVDVVLLAPGPAIRPRLYRDDAHPRAHPPADTGRQRSTRGARFARKTVRYGFPRAHAADAHRPRQGGDRNVPRRTWRSGDEAALWFRRRVGVQDGRSGPKFRLALRSVQRQPSRAVGDSEVPAGGGARRQTDHSRRREGERRSQSGAYR